MVNKNIIKIRKKLDILDNALLEIIKKRSNLVDLVIKNKKFKKDIVDKKRIAVILKTISKKSKIKKLVITDTIDNSKKIKNNNKIEVLSISSLMAEAIKRIANSNSVSDLFN